MAMKLTVLSRNYCHLCDDLIAALKAFQGRNQVEFDIEVIDVDADAELESKYGDKVPVLLHGESEICHYYLDETKLAAELLKTA
jgi:glutaredoxin